MGWLLWFGQPPAAYCAEAGNLGGWGGDGGSGEPDPETYMGLSE